MVEFDGCLDNDGNAPNSHTGAGMDVLAHAQQRLQSSIVLVLDESCQDQLYANPRLQNGIEGLHPSSASSPPEGILSKSDIDILLTTFDKVITTPSTSYCLSLLTSNNSMRTPPPILFLISLSPQSLSPPASPRIANAVPSETSSGSSASHKKHPQSDSSERILAYGPEFLQLVSSQGHFGLAHVLCVALCQQGDLWNLESLTRLGDCGVGDILTVPCEPSNVSGLYLHLQGRILHSFEDSIAIARYRKTSVAPQPRKDVFSSWMESNTIIDAIVQSFAPQPNLLARPISSSDLLAPVSTAHLSHLATIVNEWDFHAGTLEGADLIWSSVLILEHVLNSGGKVLHPFKIARDQLVQFMLTVRSCYQPTNHYHNFRHAIDVLQATFQILVLSNLLPPLPVPHPPLQKPSSAPSYLPPGYFTPIELLGLCIAAIGHDAAHPGVTNAFLAASKSSLATVFNERSVLENLHCLTISRIIEDRWPALFAGDEGGKLRRLVLEMILSTDMALHFDFMERFEALRRSGISSSPVDDKQQRLICCCIMKSADISNLARPLTVSTDWTLVLQKEVSAQEDLVDELDIVMTGPMSPTTTRGSSPTKAEQESQLAKSQLSFIDMFAAPLWSIGAEAFCTGMALGLDQIHENRKVWMSKVLPASPTDGSGPDKRDELRERGVGADSLAGESLASTAATDLEGTVGGVRKVTSNPDVKESPRGRRRMRKEKSFSSLMFWKKSKVRQQAQS